MAMKSIDEVGNVYGRLTVMERVENNTKRRGAIFRCECSCGNSEYLVFGGDLRKGRVNSCGCYKSELVTKNNTTHGMKSSRIYRIYHNMITRCTKKNNPGYERYGKRGIKVCDEWSSETGFSNFLEWSMNNGYSEELSIDRINNDGNYEPANCRWVTNDIQANNKSTSRFYELNGETKTVSQWSKRYNINYDNLINRLNKGMSLKDALIDMEVNIDE